MSAMDASGEGAPIDDGAAIHYTAVALGTPVYSSDGVVIGTVQEMLDNFREHIFDGVIFRDNDGAVRFAYAPEVARTAERGVTLNLNAEEAANLGPPEKSAGKAPQPGGSGSGMLGRLFGRGKR
jgi:hypothetical protein